MGTLGFWYYDRLDENYPDQIFSTYRNKRDARFILSEYIKDSEEFKTEISENMFKCGNAREQETLRYILDDLAKLIPKRLPKRKQITQLNLLQGIINLWAIGKATTHNEMIQLLRRELKAHNTKFDPIAEALCYAADIKYQIENERKSKLRDFLMKYHSDKIVIRGKKVVLRRGVTEPAWRHNVSYAQPMSYTEALREANKKHFLRGCIIPPEEFDKREIDLQNYYKNFRSRQARRGKRISVQKR